MAAVGKQIAVDASAAVKIVSGRYAIIVNQDAVNSVFLGGPTVTSADGYELKPNDQVQVDAMNDEVHGICAAAKTARVDVLSVRRSYH
jgi:hypothetical protein